jgi:hypothetical protein
MLKATTKLNATKKEVNVFPCLRVAKTNGMIVLFSGKTTGTVVDKGKGPHTIGFHLDVWFPYDDPDHWSPLNPGSSITITVG